MKSAAFLIAIAGLVMADDWPQWLGPDRDGTWHEQGVIAEFPETGPGVRWRVPVGLGYSGPSVADGKVFLMDYVKSDGELINNPAMAVPLKGRERVLCLDAETGKKIWEDAVGRDYELSYPAGPRATVAVAGGRAYALGAMGQLRCLDVDDGRPLWEVDLVEKYSPEFPIWGYSAHPLVHGDLVITMAGGDGSAVVALDAETGEEEWTALSAGEPGYSPPSIVEWAGREQLIVFTPEEVAALVPASGEVLWSQPLKPNYRMSIAAPQFEDGLLYASGHGRVGALFRLDSGKPAAERVWTGKPKTSLYSANATPVIAGGTMYGADADTSSLIAVDLDEGERLWQETEAVVGGHEGGGRHGTVFLTRHEPSGRFYLFNEVGELIIAELSPERYTELDKAKVLEPTNEAFGRPVVWAAPAFALKSAFVRNDEELVRVDLAE